MSSTVSPLALDAQERVYALHASRNYDSVASEQLYKIINEEWEAILARYPLLFAGDNIGLSAGVGWWPALEDAFNEITGILNTYQGLGFNAVQIKEKFGGLRFYYDCGRTEGSQLSDELLQEARAKIDHAVMEAERKASTACEICGQPGTRMGKHWIKNLCEEHKRYAS